MEVGGPCDLLGAVARFSVEGDFWGDVGDKLSLELNMVLPLRSPVACSPSTLMLLVSGKMMTT
jgi:hypothetical protein